MLVFTLMILFIVFLVFIAKKVQGPIKSILKLIIRLLLIATLLSIFIPISFKTSIFIGNSFPKGSDIISNVFYHIFLAASLVLSFYFASKIEEYLFREGSIEK